MIQLEVSGDKALITKFKLFPGKLRQKLLTKMTGLAIDLERHIKEDKLSGQVLNVRSGRLRRSITHRIDNRASGITATVFSGGNIPYAAIHEYGGQTGPHDIYPRNAKALAFQMLGHTMYSGFQSDTVFAKVVHHPGSKMPERSYMRTGLADFREKILQGMNAAVMEAWNQR